MEDEKKTNKRTRQVGFNPIKKVKLNLKTGQMMEHIYTEEEKQIIKNGGKINPDEITEWKVLEPPNKKE